MFGVPIRDMVIFFDFQKKRKREKDGKEGIKRLCVWVIG